MKLQLLLGYFTHSPVVSLNRARARRHAELSSGHALNE